MRLIDADKVIEIIKEMQKAYPIEDQRPHAMGVRLALFDCRNLIENQPTAYAVNNVCEELCELFECSDECKSKFYYGLGCGACMWGDVLNIVKRGGING